MGNIIKDPISATLTEEFAKLFSEMKKAARAMYGKNMRITDDNYDKSLAVKCVNGTFVGKKTENVIVYKGIPFVGEQPVGVLRWKAPVDVVPDDGVYEASLAVKCINGTFVGKKTDNIVTFRGIPFVGQQPVGNLRWRDPVDVVPDDGVYEAYYNGKCCPQREIEFSAAYVQGEDCLYLNIWKTDDASAKKKTVMVWVHGGGYEIGGTADPGYDFQNFVTENPDVIVVSIAYRLGVLGFLHLSHLPDGEG